MSTHAQILMAMLVSLRAFISASVFVLLQSAGVSEWEGER
jgi:hypothetical protein